MWHYDPFGEEKKHTQAEKTLYYLPSATYKNERRFIVKMPYVTNKGFRVEPLHSGHACTIAIFHQHPSSFSIMSPTLLTHPLTPVRFQSVTWFLRTLMNIPCTSGTAEGEGLVGPRPHHFFAPPPPLFENQILWFYSFFRFSIWKNYFQLSALPLFTLLRGPCTFEHWNTLFLW